MSEHETPLDSANMPKKPFVCYTLDEDKKEENSETLTIRINKEERELLEELKFLFSYGADAKVFKRALTVLKNVTLNTFGADLIKELTEEKRRRPVSKYKVEAGKIVKL